MTKVAIAMLGARERLPLALTFGLEGSAFAAKGGFRFGLAFALPFAFAAFDSAECEQLLLCKLGGFLVSPIIVMLEPCCTHGGFLWVPTGIPVARVPWAGLSHVPNIHGRWAAMVFTLHA